jgi:hypothetical protein
VRRVDRAYPDLDEDVDEALHVGARAPDDLLEEAAEVHRDQGPGGGIGVEARGAPGARLRADPRREAGDRGVGELAPGALGVGVMAGRLAQRAQQLAVLDVHARDREDDRPREVARVVECRDGLGRARVDLLAQRTDEPRDELVAVAEVDVERLARERRALHDGRHRDLVRGPLAQQRLGSLEDLPLGLLRPAPAAARTLGGCRARHAASLLVVGARIGAPGL